MLCMWHGYRYGKGERKMSGEILFAKAGSEWNTSKDISSFPYRAYDFIEFFKICSKDQEIIGITVDVERHCISLLFQKKEK